MFEPVQFREYIRLVLISFGELSEEPWVYSEDAVELLMLTAAQESHLGRYLKQIQGPARGVFQIEPSTMADLIRNYLMYRDKLGDALKRVHGDGLETEIHLTGNLAFQIVVARLIYRRVPEPLPNRLDVTEMAEYWKKYWNTHLGKGTVQEAVDNYYKYVVNG